MKRKPIKVGDRIFFEYFGTNEIGSAIALEVIPRTYRDDDGKPIPYMEIVTGYYDDTKRISVSIEDYMTLAPSNPRVRAYQKAIREKERSYYNNAYTEVGAKTAKEKEMVRKALRYAITNPWKEE